MRTYDVSIIHHRTPDILGRALAHLASAAPTAAVRVLDTGPDVGPAKAAAAPYARASVTSVPNHSYAAAVNHALRAAGNEIAIVMNADVFVADGTLDALLAPFGDPDVALVGPLGRTPEGRLQDQGLPYRWTTRAVEGRGPAAAVDAPWLSGFLFAARRDAARDVGGMDAGLRFFNEDLEWCLRLRRGGWRCRLVGADVDHLGGAATPQAGRFLVEGLRGGMLIADRYHGPIRRELQRIALGTYAAVRARTDPPSARPTWRAVVRMMRSGRYDHSAFGATLADDAPGFPDAWPGSDGP